MINPGQDVTVSFSDLGGVPFARKTFVHVDVARVPAETDPTNNKAQLPGHLLARLASASCTSRRQLR